MSANVREDREIFIHVCENLKLCVTRVTRGRRDRGRKREEAIGQMVQHGPTFDSEIQERKGIVKQAKNAHNHREWQIYH